MHFPGSLIQPEQELADKLADRAIGWDSMEEN